MVSPHFQACPGAKTGFVFICPGRFEAARGFPCAAGTGANLARVLVELNLRLPGVFVHPNREKYVITNSWQSVEYPALTGRSVPTEAEVLTDANLERLQREIGTLDAIVACGVHAHVAVRTLWDRGAIRSKVAYGRHLSQRSVNMIRGASDTPGRIRVWCDGIVSQFCACD